MIQPRPQRKRGVILTPKGLKKIQDAIKKEFPDRRNYEAISEKTHFRSDSISGDTVSNILKQKSAVDKKSIESLFKSFGLALEDDDFQYPDPCQLSKLPIDWDEAPDVSMLSFYGRTEELATLTQWIVEKRYRLVLLSGMHGVGKTTLAVKLIEQIQGDFEYIIWRSLNYALSVQDILAALLKLRSNQQETEADSSQKKGNPISLLIKYLREHRCLLILDDAESILQEDYSQGYEEYRQLLRRVGEQQHQSCLVLISQEQLRDIASSAGETRPVRIFPLEGLQEEAAKEILKAKNLADLDQWGELIEQYSRNPMALNIVSTYIQELFGGSVSEFLGLNTLVTGELGELLEQQFKRLNPLEKEIAYWLVCEWEPISRQQLQHTSRPLSPSEFIEAIQSLNRRSMLIKTNTSLLTLQALMMNYVKKNLREYVFREALDLIENQDIAELNFIINYDFVKQNKRHKILTDVKGKLCKSYRAILIKNTIIDTLLNLREQLRVEERYAEKNLENLLEELQLNLNKS